MPNVPQNELYSPMKYPGESQNPGFPCNGEAISFLTAAVAALANGSPYSTKSLANGHTPTTTVPSSTIADINIASLVLERLSGHLLISRKNGRAITRGASTNKECFANRPSPNTMPVDSATLLFTPFRSIYTHEHDRCTSGSCKRIIIYCSRSKPESWEEGNQTHGRQDQARVIRSNQPQTNSTKVAVRLRRNNAVNREVSSVIRHYARSPVHSQYAPPHQVLRLPGCSGCKR